METTENPPSGLDTQLMIPSISTGRSKNPISYSPPHPIEKRMRAIRYASAFLWDCSSLFVCPHGVDHVPKAQVKPTALFKDLAEVLCCFFVDESAECIDSVNEHLIGSPVAF